MSLREPTPPHPPNSEIIVGGLARLNPDAGTVTESTIIATIHCPDVGYCLFRNPLVTHISYHVPSLLL